MVLGFFYSSRSTIRNIFESLHLEKFRASIETESVFHQRTPSPNTSIFLFLVVTHDKLSRPLGDDP